MIAHHRISNLRQDTSRFFVAMLTLSCFALFALGAVVASPLSGATKAYVGLMVFALAWAGLGGAFVSYVLAKRLVQIEHADDGSVTTDEREAH